MCLPSSDMLVTLWLCQNCTLQTFSDAGFKWKQLTGYLLYLGVKWVSSYLNLVTEKELRLACWETADGRKAKNFSASAKA